MKLLMMIIPLVYIAGNGYLYWRTLQAISGLPVWAKVTVSVLFWVAAFSLFAAIGMREVRMPEGIMKAMFVTGSVWMVFLLYSVLLLALFDIIRLFVPALGPSLFYAFPLTCCLLLYGYENYRNPKVEHIVIDLEKEFEGGEFTAVAISDVHLGYGTGPKALQRYVELINAQKPDVIFISGDLIDNSLRPLMDKPFDEILNTLEAPMGIYMVPGNHEYISGADACEEYIRNNTGIHFLRDSLTTLPNGIQVIGRDDRSNRRRMPLEELMSQADAGKPVIVLDHQPYELALTDSLGVDIQLSGHTHNGQVWPLNMLIDRMYEQGHGYRKWKNSHIYVSSGLSLWGPPFRIGTNSDLAVITVKPNPLSLSNLQEVRADKGEHAL
ncbi:MAG: metallophosphoesterase [Bacteroidales bacterium]|nr:metallophosphoesterase [Bacteroidales bacterium]